ncbi:acylneuraminate cytidylyltransferase [Microbacterium sp. B35-04]|uniref:acylneuraminate cytidylyltransferase n=1 Tax=unclassified Microbacterium TaxID=2609290 RepID=UPI0013D126E0|nr:MULTISPECIES: acylneuraminate cytidylyltransferase [unclassified Microbacterium]KAF2413714.1 acylneuraminate cytidylyltransferase [Microbacterium sp. B35-04]KAF2416570.1 acylneuraminate cytidylyltransferase [Microbacterium sp. B35-30]
MSEAVAIIPARGGSKGIARKNLQRVGGVPLVARAVDAARRCPAIDRVVVTTDDADIAAVAAEWGAEIVERPAQLSGDQASSETALLHALDALEARKVDVGVLAFLQATSPFIDVDALAAAVQLVRSRRRDSVFSAVETYGFLWEKGLGDAAEPINHEIDVRPRRQDREPHYLETGGFYVMRAAGFRAAQHRFFGSVGIAGVAPRTAIEIDTPDEMELARRLAPLVDRDIRGDGGVAVDAVVTDFDGVHTDDTVRVDQNGLESVTVSRSDGMGVSLLRAAGIPFLILSTEANPVVAARARKLGVDVRQAAADKAAVLREWAEDHSIPLSRIAYLGNDVNDLACLELVGWPIAVPEAHPLVLSAARVVLDSRGGDGAVRDLAERVLAARQSAATALHEAQRPGGRNPATDHPTAPLEAT